MVEPTAVAERPEWDRLERYRSRAESRLFRDDLGVLVFLGALLFFGLYWRIGIFVTDNWTIANTLVAVADGHLHLEEAVYGPPGVKTPGTHIVDGTVFGRNYGQVSLALPVLVVVEAVAWLVDLRIAIAGTWSLLLLAFSVRVGSVVGSSDRFTLIGSVGALLAFVLNVVVARPIEPRMHALVALQVGTMLAGAFLGVVMYRLVADIHDRPTGVFAASATVLATPVGFWASLPKRHVTIALLVMLVLYSFYTSRTTESPTNALVTRTIAYVSVGLVAWIHAPEALVVFVVLVPLDLATAPSNTPRQLAVIGVAFLVSLVPFLLTNQLIAGHPLQPPRLLSREPSAFADPVTETPTPTPTPEPSTPTPTPTPEPPTATPTSTPEPATPTPPEATGTADTATATDVTRSTAASETVSEAGISATDTASPTVGVPTPGNGSRGLSGVIDPLVELGSRTTAVLADWAVDAVTPLAVLADEFAQGYDTAVNDPGRLVQAFIRSEHRGSRATVTDLSLLESTPLLAFLLLAPVMAVKRARPELRQRLVRFLSSPVRQTDTLALGLVIGYGLLYISRLPLNAMWTVRYVLPVIPIGVYFIARLSPVREVVSAEGRLLAYSYAGLVLVGGQLLLVYLVRLDPTRGEVMQFHGLLGLVAAVVAAIWVVLYASALVEDTRLGALAIAVSLATGTLFVLLTGLEYFVVDHFALGMVDVLSDAIPIF